jgi:hypothetical protein
MFKGERDYDEQSFYATRLQELCALLPGLRTLDLYLDDKAFRFKEKRLSMYTEEMVELLPGLRSLILMADGLGTRVFDADADDDVARDASIKATLSRMLKAVKLDAIDASMICPQSDWFPLETLFSAQSTLRELVLGFAFTKDMNFILGALAASGFTRLRRLELYLDPAYPTDDQWDMIEPETFKAHVLDATADFVRVCTKLEHFDLAFNDDYEGLAVDFWTFLGHIDTLPRLKSFSVMSIFFEEIVAPPEGYKVAFPFLECFQFYGDISVTMFNKMLTSSCWPSLKTMEFPLMAWTSQALTALLVNAPQLQKLDISTHNDVSLLPQPTSIYPRMRRIRVRFKSPQVSLETIQETIVLPLMLAKFPNASIHIAFPEKCCLYYGEAATMDGRRIEEGHEDSEHSAYSEDDFSDDWETESDEEYSDYYSSE